VIDKNKSVGPDISGQILKLGREAMIPHLAHLLDITVNNATIPSDWNKIIVLSIYKGVDRSLVSNYRHICLTSVVSKKDWIFKGQHGFQPGFSESLNYSLGDIVIPKANNCKYLGIILCSDLSWTDQVNYTVKKAWKALHFTMCILKKGNSNTKSLAYASLV
jgi:hypothetical protein